MPVQLVPVRCEADILPEWRDTPVGQLLRILNLGGAAQPAGSSPTLLIAQCLDHAADLGLPAGFGLTLRTGAASLKRIPFKISWAIGIAGVEAVALVAHRGCGMVGLPSRREEFVTRLMEVGGWERPAAEQHFDHWSDLFEIEEPGASVAAEARRLQARYPRLAVAPLLYESASSLVQVVETAGEAP